MKRFFFFIFSLAVTGFVAAQIPVGKFRTHVPLHSFHSVAVADDYVYAASTNGLLLLDKATRDSDNPDVTSWSKVDGLSDIDISKIHYDRDHKTLVVAYANGNLDFIVNDNLYNIRDIKNKPLTGSKEPRHIRSYGDRIYIAYPFGIVIIDPRSRLIEDTWFTKRNGVQITANDIAVSNDYYFISTDEGIYSIPKSSGNPANFHEWELSTTAGVYVFDHIVCNSGHVYANKNATAAIFGTIPDTLYELTDHGWTATAHTYSDVRSMTTSNGELVVTNWDYVQTFDDQLNLTYLAYWYHDNNYPNCYEALLDGDLIWAADNTYGLVQYNKTYFYYKFYTVSGPFAATAEGICSTRGLTVTVPGTRKKSTAYSPGWLYPSVSWFSNQEWHYNATDFQNYDSLHPTNDFNNVVINPNDEKEWYIASWGNGLFKCRDGRVVAHYNAANSILDSTSGGSTFVSGLAFDNKGNLWITNSQCSRMLKMLEPNGTWHAYNISSGVVTSSPNGVVAEHVLVDSRGYKWITFPRDDNFNRYHLVAFSDNGTYENMSDDKFARIDMNVAAEVNSATVYCIAEDHDGEIWIGTDKGVKVIYYPNRVFEGTAYPRNILLEQDGYVSVLLEWEEVTAIAVDGANRKWIGTGKAGVFLMSEDGQEQLLHFTAEDNPLFSNQITSISIDPLSGEVFFGTAKGLTSYRGTATAGHDSYEDLPVFPNPVGHDYDGVVTVQGLKENSLCKITDSSGKLVWQGYSNGGELVWHCQDHFGRRPATGVYYVMCSDDNGKEHIVTKFLFIQ